MNLTYNIAKRYLFSKKQTNAVNIIAGVSATSIGVGAMALVMVLSVFNGLESLVKSMYTVFYPEIVVTSNASKTFEINTELEQMLKQENNILHYSFILEDNALLEYGGQQQIATIKGIDRNYFKVIPEFDSFVVKGTKDVFYNNGEFMLLGAGIAYGLNLNTTESIEPVGIYMPKKTAASLSNVENSFQKQYIYSCGSFAISDEFDTKYVLVPLSFFQQLSMQYNQISKVEIKLKDKNNDAATIASLQQKLGADFQVKNRYQQNEILYKVLRTEKWIVFAILAAILCIASFNITGALSMLVLDKKKDLAVLTALGLERNDVVKLFLLEGVLLSLLGAVVGIVLAVIFLIIQDKIGIVPMPGSTFVIQHYPVKIQLLDIIVVFILVILIGIVASWLPSKYAAKNIEKEYLSYLS
ncbi:MAG: ABC transporter permease [Sphingobacteriales bacterium]|jgi:lipoprotein-releasing system permease protein|nr:MAG: ABC transporter permease [Sphingobacteriales bacterium]